MKVNMKNSFRRRFTSSDHETCQLLESDGNTVVVQISTKLSNGSMYKRAVTYEYNEESDDFDFKGAVNESK